MVRWTSLVFGAAAFLAAHIVEVMFWTAWFSAEWRPFFMNSGRSVAFTAACVLVAGFVAAILAKDRRDALIRAGNVTAGAAIVMTVLILWPEPGRLFPIAIMYGVAILAVGSYLGAIVAFPFKSPGSGAGNARGRTRV